MGVNTISMRKSEFYTPKKLFLAELDEEQAGWDIPAPGKAKLFSPACKVWLPLLIFTPEMEVHVSTSEPASSQSPCSNDEGVHILTH